MGRIKKQILLLLAVAFITLFAVIQYASADEIIVAFEKTEYSVLAGKSETIKPVIQGTKAKGKYTYSSSDESVATVSKDKVKGVSVGDATITCTVSIGDESFSCSYLLHVRQPVVEIEVPSETIVLPAFATLRESPVKVLPENAANPELEFKSSKPGVASVRADGTVSAGRSAGTTTITCKATDGSGVKATFKVTVPKGAWFSVDSDVVIDNPEGVFIYFVHTFSGSFNTGTHYCSNDVIREGYSSAGYDEKEKDKEEFVKTQPFYMSGFVSEFEKIQLVPQKVGKGKFVVVSNGNKASVNVEVLRSAVYEPLKYDQLEKTADKNKGLRFSVMGNIYAIDKESKKVYISYEGDTAKQVVAIVPDSIRLSQFAEGDGVTLKGFFEGMENYKTETGLTKSIPSFSAETLVTLVK